MFNNNLTLHLLRSLVLILLLGGLCTLLAQNPDNPPPPRVEIGAFGGGSWPRTTLTAAPATPAFVEGGLGGIRATERLGRWLALEQSFSYGVNNVHVPTTNGFIATPSRALTSHTAEGYLGVLGYVLPSRWRFRPFLKVGVGGYWFIPQNKDDIQPRPDTQFQPAVVPGAGFKVYFKRRFGMRVDGDASYMGQPHYKLPGVPLGPPNVYMPRGGHLWHFQLTAGVFLGLGRVEAPAPPPPPTPVLNVTAEEMRVIDAGCPGDMTQPVELSVTANTNLPGHRPSYAWTVNGNPAGENSPNFRFNIPSASGQYKISVTVTDDASASTDRQPAVSVTKDMALVTVKEYQPPTITASASPSQLNYGDKAMLTVTPQGGACNGQLTYTCNASEGSVLGTPPNQYDSTGVTFDMTDRSRPQSKTVAIECTVTDSRGGTGTAKVPVRVDLPAALTIQRFDDIIFSPGNARVNNCAKRILLEEVYPQLTQHPDWDLVLIGHTDAGEKPPRGSQITALDRERVLNVAATLTAGADTCPKLELSRIRVAFVGSAQVAEPRPGFCGTSTRTMTTERPGQAVSEADQNAKYRRVEVYLVPKGAALPEGAMSLQAVPESDVTPRGCPK